MMLYLLSDSFLATLAISQVWARLYELSPWYYVNVPFIHDPMSFLLILPCKYLMFDKVDSADEARLRIAATSKLKHLPRMDESFPSPTKDWDSKWPVNSSTRSPGFCITYMY